MLELIPSQDFEKLNNKELAEYVYELYLKYTYFSGNIILFIIFNRKIKKIYRKLIEAMQYISKKIDLEINTFNPLLWNNDVLIWAEETLDA